MTKLEGRIKVMACILARKGGLMQTTNGTGERIRVLTEEAQDFLEDNYKEAMRKVKA